MAKITREMEAKQIIDDFKVNAYEHMKEDPNIRINYLVEWAQEDQQAAMLDTSMSSYDIYPYFKEALLNSPYKSERDDAAIRDGKQIMKNLAMINDYWDIVDVAKHISKMISGDTIDGEKKWYVIGKCVNPKTGHLDDKRDVSKDDVDRLVKDLRGKLDLIFTMSKTQDAKDASDKAEQARESISSKKPKK